MRVINKLFFWNFKYTAGGITTACHQKSNFKPNCILVPLIFLVPAHICPTFSRIFLVGSTKMPCFQWGMVALHHRSGFCLPVNFTPLFITSPARLLYSTFQQVRHPLGSGWCAHHSHIHWLGSSPGGSAMRWSSECIGSPFASSSCCPAEEVQITLCLLTYSRGNFYNFPLIFALSDLLKTKWVTNRA